MLAVLCVFLPSEQITPNLPFLSVAVLSVSCWLSPQAFPFDLAAIAMIPNILLFQYISWGRDLAFVFSQATFVFQRKSDGVRQPFLL